MVILLRYVILLELGLLIISCSSVQTKFPIASKDVHEIWYTYERYAEQQGKENTPYRIKGTLLYHIDKAIKRLSVIIWSNGKFPICLDGMAGMNTTVVRLHATEDKLIIYSTMDKEAKVFSNTDKVFLELEKPLPFGFYDFVSLIRGQFYNVFGKQVQGVSPLSMPNGNIMYTLLGGKLSGTLELSQSGLPVKWENSTLGWSLTIAYDDQTKLPSKVVLFDNEKNKIVFIVKGRETFLQNFTNSQLQLILPEGVDVQYIAYE